jgi:preprotein translocase subunit SecA
VSKSIETAQKRVESYHFSARKHVLEYDDVMNKQREVIYSERKTILESGNLKEYIFNMIEDVIDSAMAVYAAENLHPAEWDYAGLISRLKLKFLISLNEEELNKLSRQELYNFLVESVEKAYAQKAEALGAEKMKKIEKFVLLQAIDTKWKDHLLCIDHLREGIHLRGYGQRDPLVEYQREAYDMFMAMVDSIREDSLEYIFRIQVVETETMTGVFRPSAQKFLHPEAGSIRDIRKESPAAAFGDGDFNGPMPPSAPDFGPQEPVKRDSPKVGRNDPCPCGSGRKFKKCCGQ